MNFQNKSIDVDLSIPVHKSQDKRSICFGSFYNDTAMELGLNVNSLLLLNKFISFVLSGKMKTLPSPYNKYYWVDYETFGDQLFMTDRMVRDGFSRLCGRFKTANKNIVYPLILHTVSTGDNRGTQCYFAFQAECGKSLLPFELSDRLQEFKKHMTTMKLIEPDKALNPQKSSKLITPQIQDLFETLSCININGSESHPLFTDRTPDKNKGKWTKQLLSAASHLWELYEGKFLRENEITEEFWHRNRKLGTREEIHQQLKAVKGSWDKVVKLVIQAARNYRQWFWSGNMPETKDWLPQDIGTWLYDRYAKRSLFAVCIIREPLPIGELLADRIYDSETITADMAEIGNRMYRKEWDAVQFWSRIKSIGEWYDKNKQDLCERDRGCQYWFDGGKDEWFKNYYEWLMELTGGGQTLNLGNLGTGNRTWCAWCSEGIQRHDIEINIF